MLKKKKYRVLIIYLLVFLFLSISAKYFFYDYSARLIGNLLFEIAQIRGNKNYSFQNQEVSFFPLERQLLIKNLIVQPSLSDSTDNRMIYQVEIPEIFVDIESLSDIYFRKKLSITGLSLKKPSLRVKKEIQDTVESKSFALNANELYERISIYLTELQVESFDLDSGTLVFEDEVDDVYTLKNFSLSIDKFSMDSAHLAQNKNPFFTENVYLKLSKQEFTLRDHSHRISFDSLIFSSGDSSFYIHNLLYKNISNHDKQDSVNIPLVSLTSMDVNAFYTNNTIDLGQIHLNEPYIHLHPTGESGKKRTEPLINDSKFTYKLDSIWFTRGSIAYSHNEFLFRTEALDLHHGEYILFPGTPLISLTQIIEDVSLSGRDIKLKSEQLNFTLSELKMNSNEDFLTIRDIDLIQQNTGHELSLSSKNARVSKFEIHNRDFYEIDSILIENPTVIYRKLKDTVVESKRSENYVIIDYLNAISGSFSGYFGGNQIEMSGIDMIGQEINTGDGIKNLERIKVLGKKYQVKIDGESISGEEWCFNGMNNLLTTGGVYSKFGEVGELALYNPDLEKLGNDRYYFDSLIIKNADILLTGKSDNNSQNDFYKKADYGKIRIENSKLGWKSNSDRLNINNVNLTLLSDQVIHYLYVKGISGLQENFSFSLEDPHFEGSKRLLSANNIKLSEGKELLINLDSIHLENFPQSIIGIGLDSLSKVIKRITFYQPDIIGRISQKRKTENNPVLPPIRIVNGKLNLSFPADQKEKTSISADSIYLNTYELSSLKGFIETMGKCDLELKNLFLVSKNDSINIPILSHHNKKWKIQQLKASLEKLGTVSMNQGTIINPGLKKIIDSRELVVDSILTEGIEITLSKVKMNNQSNESGKSKSAPLTSIDIPYLSLSNNDLNFLLNEENIHLPGIDLTVKGIWWKEKFNLDSLLAYASIELSGESFEYQIKDIHTKFNTGRYTYSDENKSITIENITSSPTLDKDEYMEMMDTESDWINGSIDEIYLTQTDIRDFLFDKTIAAQAIELKNMSLNIYRDKRLPDPHRYKPLPHSKITKSPYKIEIDTIHVQSNRITYVEKNDKSDYLGRLFFSNVDGQITHIYSEPEKIANSPRLTLKASGDIMNSGFFKTTVHFITIDTSGAFTMKGEVGNMDLTKLNPILENSAQVSVNSGTMRRIEFDYEANNQFALGEMKFYYDDLKISVFNKDNLPKGLGASFKTFFANTFIVNKRNPHFLFVREGDIFFERLEERSIINYWAKALLSGIVTSIGARNNKKEIRQLNQETKERLENLSD